MVVKVTVIPLMAQNTWELLAGGQDLGGGDGSGPMESSDSGTTARTRCGSKTISVLPCHFGV